MQVPSNQASGYVNAIYRGDLQSTGLVSGAATADPSVENADRSLSLSEESKRLSTSTAVYPLDTGSGPRDFDLNTFFDPPTPGAEVKLDSKDLLLPSPHNVATLQSHINAVFPDFLAQHGIPEAPASIRFDNTGQLVLPADYPYADKLEAALDSNPALSKELRTVNALASHVAAIQETQPFHDEYAKAQTQAEIDAIIDKYRYLFSDNRSYPEIALMFNKSGEMSVTADNQVLV